MMICMSIIHQQFFRQRTGWKLTRGPQRPSVNQYSRGKHFVVQLNPSSKAQLPAPQKALGCCLVVVENVDRGSRVLCL